MRTLRSLTRLVWIFIVALAAMPALAQEGPFRSAIGPEAAVGTIFNGVDLWRTPADGTSFMSFADNPIPAGFFCGGSEPFAGTIRFRGVPVATVPENALTDPTRSFSGSTTPFSMPRASPVPVFR